MASHPKLRQVTMSSGGNRSLVAPSGLVFSKVARRRKQYLVVASRSCRPESKMRPFSRISVSIFAATNNCSRSRNPLPQTSRYSNGSFGSTMPDKPSLPTQTKHVAPPPFMSIMIPRQLIVSKDLVSACCRTIAKSRNELKHED